uniref:Lipoprotein n=1 Tax=Parastrongyloides trichosuri TaxID=131310 RepID=A0A0N5A428_PARTI
MRATYLILLILNIVSIYLIYGCASKPRDITVDIRDRKEHEETKQPKVITKAIITRTTFVPTSTTSTKLTTKAETP